MCIAHGNEGIQSDFIDAMKIGKFVNKFLAPFFHPVVNYHLIDMHPFQRHQHRPTLKSV